MTSVNASFLATDMQKKQAFASDYFLERDRIRAIIEFPSFNLRYLAPSHRRIVYMSTTLFAMRSHTLYAL